MRRLMALAAAATVVTSAMAGGNDSVVVEVSNAPAVRGADPAFRPLPASYAHSLLNNLRRSERLDKWVNEIVNLSLEQVRIINKEDVAVSFIELCPEDGCAPALGHVHGEEMLYASGLARVFYSAALYNAKGAAGGSLSAGMKADIMAALRDGNVDASNRLIGHLGGSRGSEYTNAYIASLGYQNFNVNQSFITGNPSDNDAARLGGKLPLNHENSNRITANQAATLFYLLDREALVSPGASQAMKAYMFRPVEQQKVSPLQGIAAGLPVGSKLVSINGFTVRNYHETGLVELPNGKRYVLSVMTKFNEYPTVFIPLLSRSIAHRLMTSTGSDDPAQHLYIAPLASN